MQKYSLRNPRWRRGVRVPLGPLATVFVYLSNGGAGVVTEVVIEKVLVLSECDLMNVIEKVRVRSESYDKTIDE